jgi:XTP/dITP diphosphohydrolase
MNELVIASNNPGKIRELQALLPDISLLSMREIGFTEEIAEPYELFEENALAKARAVFAFSERNILADDSGLCVRGLNNAPGVHSAYYGGEPRSDEQNNLKLLEALEGHDDRSAFYKAVLCLIWNDQVFFFEGICEGRISEEARGAGGFGYDPLFIPKGYDQTFGELPAEVKNTLSHRGRAVQRMVQFLNERTGT